MSSGRKTQRGRHRKSERKFWKQRLRFIQSTNMERGSVGLPSWKQFHIGGGGTTNMFGLYNIGNISSNSNSENELSNNHQEESFIEKTVIINGKNYTYREEEGGNYLYLFRREGVRPCFEIDISIDNKNIKYAHLRSFYNFSDCSKQNNSMGKDMLLAVVELLKQREDILYMEFTDDSGKELPNGKNIPLGDMYFVCTGKTWYESILPIVPDDLIADDIAIYRNTVQTNNWNYVFKRLKKRYKNITIPVNISDIDPSSPGSAMKVFRRIKEEKTDFFADYGYNIALSSDCHTMSGTVWRYYFPMIV